MLLINGMPRFDIIANAATLLFKFKTAAEDQFARGTHVNIKHYKEIPALSSMFLTGNPAPPRDDGYQRRSIRCHMSKDELHTEHEVKEFEEYFGKNADLLGIFGDFIARCIVKDKPDILFSADKSHEEITKEIIIEFYKLANRPAPEWLDFKLEYSKVGIEDKTHEIYFALRGFFMNAITDAYSRHIRTLYKSQDPEVVIDFLTRLNFCLDNKLVPFLHKHTNKQGMNEIIIPASL
jgi:hypothetical protein